MGAERRKRFGMAAMVALQLAEQAMLDQPSRAMRAFEAMAAGAAQGERRIAAAIEEQHRLLAGLERLRQSCDERRREEALPLGRIAAHVDDANFGEARIAEPRRQVKTAMPPLLDIDEGFERGRRRDEH